MWMKRGFTSLFLTSFMTEWNKEQKENLVLFGLLTEINRMIKLERSFENNAMLRLSGFDIMLGEGKPELGLIYLIESCAATFDKRAMKSPAIRLLGTRSGSNNIYNYHMKKYLKEGGKGQ